MIHKKCTSLLSANIGADSSNYINHYTSWPSSFICGCNANNFMKGTQPGSFYLNSYRFGQGCNKKFYNPVCSVIELLSTYSFFTEVKIPKETFDYKTWVRLQSIRSISFKAVLYDYVDFARELASTEATTNLTFAHALNYAETTDKYHKKAISKARKKMTQSQNKESKFGQDYETYWRGVPQTQATKRKLDATDKMADITADSMIFIAEDIGEEAKKRRHTKTESSGDSSRSPTNPATTVPKDLRAAIRPYKHRDLRTFESIILN